MMPPRAQTSNYWTYKHVIHRTNLATHTTRPLSRMHVREDGNENMGIYWRMGKTLCDFRTCYHSHGPYHSDLHKLASDRLHGLVKPISPIGLLPGGHV